jgi:hypothetical protein
MDREDHPHNVDASHLLTPQVLNALRVLLPKPGDSPDTRSDASSQRDRPDDESANSH